MHNLFFHPRQVTEPESEISEAGTALMMVNLWFDGTHQPAPSSCCPTHFYLGFTRFAIFLKKHPRVWFERVNSDINQIRFFCHLTNIRVTYFRSRGDVVVILGQCFQAEIPVSLFVSWFLTFVHPGPIGEVWKNRHVFFEEHGKDEDEGYGLYVLTRRSAGLDGRCHGNFQCVSMFFKDQMTQMKANLESFAMWSWQFFDSFWDRGTCFQNGSKKSWIADHCEDITSNPSACFFCGEDGLRGSGVSEHQPGWWWNSGRTWGRHCREDVRVEQKSLGWDVKLNQLFFVGVGVLFLWCFYYVFFVVVVAVAAAPTGHMYASMICWGIFFWFLYTTLLHLHFIHVCVLYNIPNYII